MEILNVKDANNKKEFEIKINNFDDIIYRKLKEAEDEMDNTDKRYSKENISKSIDNIIG